MTIYLVVGKGKYDYISDLLVGPHSNSQSPLVITNMGGDLEPQLTIKQIHNLIRLKLDVDVYITTTSYCVLKEFELLYHKLNIDVKLVNTDESEELINIYDNSNTAIINTSINQYKQYIDLV